MAKLNKAQQKRVKEAESGFDALPAGIYKAKIVSVDPTKKGPAGPYWKFEFQITAGKYKGRKQWVNASLSEEAAWRMQEIFDACGFEYDADSDEFAGEAVKIVLSESVIGQGPRKGQPSNNVDSVLSIDDDSSADPEDEDNADEDTGDDFTGDDDDNAEDVSALGKSADDEDDEDNEASIDRLTELAGEHSLDPDDFKTWALLAEAIEEAIGEPEPEEEEPPKKAKGKGKGKAAASKKKAPARKRAPKKTDDADADFDF